MSPATGSTLKQLFLLGLRLAVVWWLVRRVVAWGARIASGTENNSGLCRRYGTFETLASLMVCLWAAANLANALVRPYAGVEACGLFLLLESHFRAGEIVNPAEGQWRKRPTTLPMVFAFAAAAAAAILTIDPGLRLLTGKATPWLANRASSAPAGVILAAAGGLVLLQALRGLGRRIRLRDRLPGLRRQPAEGGAHESREFV